MEKMFENSEAEATTEISQRRNIEDSSGGSRRIGRYLFVYGFDDQYCFQGPFRGRQCTSVALAALIFWAHRGRPHMFTPENVNEILVEGYILHCRLRHEFRVSTDPDGMVAIHDLPTLHYLELGEVWGMPVKIRLAQESYPVFTTRRRDLHFPTLGEFLATYNPGVPMPFLVTVESFTYAVIRFMNDTVALFDSHGRLRVKGCLLGEKAGFLLCPSIHDLELIFIGMYGAMAHCDIAPIEFGLPSDSVKRIEEKPGVEDECPYISMMGGRDD